MKILANDGISKSGMELLENNGLQVIQTRVAQNQLINYINQNHIDILLVRSATQVQKDVIDQCPGLKLIGRGGVGLDNIAVSYAKSKGIHVINTPAASSQSVAELVFAHIFTGIRYLYDANRNMPLDGDSKFKQLKKSYATATEIRGKTLGIIGFGRTGQAVAKIALGLGLKVLFFDHDVEERILEIEFFDGQTAQFKISGSHLEEVLRQSDFISIHVPGQKNYVIGEKEIGSMKSGTGIVNASRGGTLDEVALVKALDSGKLAFAGLDVFESEPSPEIKILMHPKISLTPHVGGSTIEAQERIGMELARKIIELFK